MKDRHCKHTLEYRVFLPFGIDTHITYYWHFGWIPLVKKVYRTWEDLSPEEQEHMNKVAASDPMMKCNKACVNKE